MCGCFGLMGVRVEVLWRVGCSPARLSPPCCKGLDRRSRRLGSGIPPFESELPTAGETVIRVAIKDDGRYSTFSGCYRDRMP